MIYLTGAMAGGLAAIVITCLRSGRNAGAASRLEGSPQQRHVDVMAHLAAS